MTLREILQHRLVFAKAQQESLLRVEQKEFYKGKAQAYEDALKLLEEIMG